MPPQEKPPDLCKFQPTNQESTNLIMQILEDILVENMDCDEESNLSVQTEANNSFEISVKELQHDIRCPVCLDIPKSAPIYTCVNGHLVCNACHPNMNNECPVCRIELGSNRNFFAEKLLSKLPIPCKFHIKGCSFQIIDRQKLERHEEECINGAIRCIRMDCDKKIPIPKFIDHMKDDHHIERKEDVPFDGLMEFEYTLFNRQKQWQEQYFQIDGMHFYSELIRTPKGFWFGWVYHLKVATSNKFRYTLSLLSEQSDKRLDVQGDCISIEDVSVTSMTNAEQHCLLFSDASVKKLAPDGRLQFRVDIYEQSSSRDNSFHSNASLHSIS